MNKIGSIALGALIITLGLTSLINPGYRVGFDKGVIGEGLGLLSYSYLSMTDAVAKGVITTGVQMGQMASILSGVVTSKNLPTVAFVDPESRLVISQTRPGQNYLFVVKGLAIADTVSLGIVFVDNNGLQGEVTSWQTGPEQLHSIPTNFPAGEFAIKQIYLGDRSNVIWNGLVKLTVVAR